MRVYIRQGTGSGVPSAVAEGLAVRVNITETASIDALFARVGEVDAVVCCAANGDLARLDTVSDTEFWSGLGGKLIGQVNVVRRALAHVRDSGAVTLTRGRFAEPVPGSSLGIS